MERFWAEVEGWIFELEVSGRHWNKQTCVLYIDSTEVARFEPRVRGLESNWTQYTFTHSIWPRSGETEVHVVVTRELVAGDNWRVAARVLRDGSDVPMKRLFAARELI